MQQPYDKQTRQVYNKNVGDLDYILLSGNANKDLADKIAS